MSRAKLRDRTAVARRHGELERDRNHREQGVRTVTASLEHQTLSPSFRAARTISKWSSLATKTDIATLTATLLEHVSTVRSGDMGRPEAMLVAQAHTLDGIFNNLAQRAYLA